MNLLARILSHGFAFAVVALIILVLIYRGDLFEEWDLPDFLAIKDKPVVTDDSGAGAVDREPATLTESGDDAAASGAPVADTAEPEPADPAAVETEETPTADTAPTDVTDTVPQVVPDTPAQTDAESAEPAAAETEETPTADTVPEVVPDTPAETDAEPAPEPAAVAEPAPVVETEPVDTEAAAPRAEEAEDTATQEAGDDSAVAAPATGEDEQAAPEAAIEDSQDAASAPSAAADSTPSEPAASADASSATTYIAAEQPAEEPAATMAPPAVETSAPTAAADDSPGVADTQAATADVEPAADTTTVDTGESETPYNVLAKAREAYWLRDFATAEQQYKRLTQLEPANPDGYGELGNMYFSRGMWDEAANAYYEAGVRLLDEGLIVQARQMVDVIRGLNGSQADELDAQINAATTSSP